MNSRRTLPGDSHVAVTLNRPEREFILQALDHYIWGYCAGNAATYERAKRLGKSLNFRLGGNQDAFWIQRQFSKTEGKRK